MAILKPNWNQAKPSWRNAQDMCAKILLEPVAITSTPVNVVLDRLRASHTNGGAFLKALHVGDDDTFDWFASRNRLSEYGILRRLLSRKEVREVLPELSIPVDIAAHEQADICTISGSGGFKLDNSLLFDGYLAQRLFAGGAYPPPTRVDGKTAKRLALDFCEAMFEQRYEDVCLYSSHEPLTPWFGGVAWDWTAILFDERDRTLWVFAITDTD